MDDIDFYRPKRRLRWNGRIPLLETGVMVAAHEPEYLLAQWETLQHNLKVAQTPPANPTTYERCRTQRGHRPVRRSAMRRD